MFNCLRTKTIKTASNLTTAIAHNLRFSYACQRSNIDPNGIKPKILFNPLEAGFQKAGQFREALDKHFKEIGLKKTSNQAYGKEFIVSASPEFFKDMTQAQIETWATDQIEFFNQAHPGAVKLAILHQDEKTPHLHIISTFEAKTTKKYRNQKGEFFKETWSLQSGYIDKKHLIELHTAHAVFNQNKGYDLDRGVLGSLAKNQPLKDFYTALSKALKGTEAEFEKMLGWVDALGNLPPNQPIGKNQAQITKTVKTLFERCQVLLAENLTLKKQPGLQKKLIEQEKKLKALSKFLDEKAKKIKDEESIVRSAQKVLVENDQLKAENRRLTQGLLIDELNKNSQKQQAKKEEPIFSPEYKGQAPRMRI